MRSLTLPLIGAILLLASGTIANAGISAGLGGSVGKSVSKNTGGGGGGDHSYPFNSWYGNDHLLDKKGVTDPTTGKKCPCRGYDQPAGGGGGYSGKNGGYGGGLGLSGGSDR